MMNLCFKSMAFGIALCGWSFWLVSQLTSNQNVQIIIVYLVRSNMENKLLEFLNRLVESGVQFEGLDEAIDYCIERGLI